MIPRTLKIRGHVYKVKQVNRKSLDSGNYAEINDVANILRLYKGLAPSRKVELVLHEAMHAMLDGHEFKDEEAIVTILGEGLTELIKANPGFIRHALKTLSQ